MFTENFSKILRDIFSAFSIKYVEDHPGCNGNDIEREFLHTMNVKFTPNGPPYGYYHFNKISDEIEKIR